MKNTVEKNLVRLKVFFKILCFQKTPGIQAYRKPPQEDGQRQKPECFPQPCKGPVLPEKPGEGSAAAQQAGDALSLQPSFWPGAHSSVFMWAVQKHGTRNALFQRIIVKYLWWFRRLVIWRFREGMKWLSISSCLCPGFYCVSRTHTLCLKSDGKVIAPEGPRLTRRGDYMLPSFPNSHVLLFLTWRPGSI